MASGTPEFMHWSKKAISWSRADHPEVMPSPGSYALVLDATFATNRRAARFSRVLIDGGSSINILYKDTMEKLGIKQRQLQNSRTVFHDIVPGLSCSLIGKILTKSSLETKITSAGSLFGLKWWTSRARTMRCLADLRWPSSWRFPITPTSR